VISPLLSNIYLDGLDWKLARNGFGMVRYADDFVVLCRSQEEAQKTLEQIKQWVEKSGLKLHPSKTRIVDASQRGGFDFLGYHFEIPIVFLTGHGDVATSVRALKAGAVEFLIKPFSDQDLFDTIQKAFRRHFSSMEKA
jgi:DNA-binding NtrC family response regulator